MDPEAVVLDVSSDEEGNNWGEMAGEVGGSGDESDWIAELLDKVDRETDDSDDVVLVSEVVLNPKPRLKYCSVKDVDDDCVILDGDPDKPVAIANDPAFDSDDVLVVGEKGQVACRDYPHSRHLCAKFPFSSTPHDRHCDQCHCYVCDSLAPCVHWGTGISSIDHCHATDKEGFWKVQRKSFKKCDEVTLPVPKAADTYLTMGLPQMNQVAPLTPPEPNYVPQVQVSRSTSNRSCSTSTNFGIPKIINQSRSQCSGYAVSKNKFQPNLVSQQLLSTCNSTIPREIRRHMGNLGPQSISHCAVFKKTGSVGAALTANRCRYSSSNNNYGSHYSRNSPALATPSGKNPNRWQDFHGEITRESNTNRIASQPNVGSITANSVPSQPKVSSHANMGHIFPNPMPSHSKVSSQPNAGNVFVNQVPSQPQVSSQPNAGNVFVNPVPSQPPVSSHPTVGNVFVNPVLSQPQVSSQPYAGSTFANSVPSQTQLSFQPNVGSTFANSVPSEPPVYSQPNPVSNESQSFFEQGNQTQSALDPTFTGLDLGWAIHTSQSNQQHPADNSQLQGVASADEPLLTAFDSHFTGSTNPGSLDFQFDSWILENQHFSGAPVVSVPPGLNVLSPEPAPIDAGIFFDF